MMYFVISFSHNQMNHVPVFIKTQILLVEEVLDKGLKYLKCCMSQQIVKRALSFPALTPLY